MLSKKSEALSLDALRNTTTLVENWVPMAGESLRLRAAMPYRH